MDDNLRAHVVISGKVQGVCFRAETQAAAAHRHLTGWVRNRPDGTVEAVFEGRADQVEDMVKWCWRGSPFARVADVATHYPRFTGEYGDFRIVR